MALTSIFTAGMNAILIFNPDAYVNSSGFLVGSLSGVMASELVIPGCAICVGLLVAAGRELVSISCRWGMKVRTRWG